jgi:aquaporin Z
MNKPLLRAYVVELLGTFAVVFFGAGVICVNYLTTPTGQQPGTTAVLGHQPGLVGLALTQGLIYAVMLTATVPIAGGFLNPAITITLWVFQRLDSVRTAWLLGAQLLGAVLAGLCLRSLFADSLLREAHLGTPHLNPLVYPDVQWHSLLTGAGIELVLTFFLIFAIFGVILGRWFRPATGASQENAAATTEETTGMLEARWLGLAAGLALTACVLLGYPLTGAATNPARWFGPVFWEWAMFRSEANQPFGDAFVYTVGPLVGALLAGLVCFKILFPGEERSTLAPTEKRPTTAPRAKK